MKSRLSQWHMFLLVTIALFPLLRPLSLGAVDSVARNDVRWTIWHEGCRVFGPAPQKDPLGDHMNPIGWLRKCINDKQVQNQGAQDRIANLNDDELKAIL